MQPAEAGTLAGVTAQTEPNSVARLSYDRFYPSPHVVSARAGDTVVLMDRKRGIYYTLNEVSGRIWELLGQGGTISTLSERLLEEYDVPRQQLEVDLAATVRQFVTDRLIALGPMPIPAPTANTLPKPASPVVAENVALCVPSVLRCGVMLLVFKTMLKVWGYGRTIDWIRRNVEVVPVLGNVDVATVEAAEYRVAMAGALYPGRALCLEQSLTLYYLLRKCGVAVKYCQGVQPYPFQAHAWIEYRGEMINDVPEHSRFFARLPEQMP